MLYPQALILPAKRLNIRSLCNLAPTIFNEENFDIFPDQPVSKKKLKVAILGAPNVGKSTLINKIVGHPVLCVSRRAHTTRQRELAAVVRNDTQVVFVDTPGLVSKNKLKRHNLDENFTKDGLRAVHEANIVGVVQDVADKFNRGRLNPNIVHILNNMDRKRAFLVLNKIDVVESKKNLLNLINRLTKPPKIRNEPKETCEGEGEGRTKFPVHWDHFTEVFLVSALNGNGVSDILDYLVKEARDGRWLLPEGQITDRPWHIVLQELVRGRLLDKLPHEIPYSLTIETEYFHENELGEIIAVVLVICPVERYRRMLLSHSGQTIRDVALQAEKDARSALRANVRLRVVVVSNEKKKES